MAGRIVELLTGTCLSKEGERNPGEDMFSEDQDEWLGRQTAYVQKEEIVKEDLRGK